MNVSFHFGFGRVTNGEAVVSLDNINKELPVPDWAENRG